MLEVMEGSMGAPVTLRHPCGSDCKDLGLVTLQGRDLCLGLRAPRLTLWGMKGAVFLWGEFALAGHAPAVHFPS